MLYRAQELRAYGLRSSDGELGRVEDLYFDNRFWTVRYLVVDTGGWLVQRRVLISSRAVVTVDGEGKNMTTALTKEQVEKSPSPDEYPTVSRQFEIAYNDYYNYSPYWIGPFAWGANSAPLPAQDAAPLEERESWDSHLYGAAEVSGFGGYAVKAADGDIGHVADLVVSDVDWVIRYLVVDTRNWLPGKHVLLPPQWTKVDWEDATASVELTRDAIKEAPEYRPDTPITREYEAKLHSHYCRPGYWSGEPACSDSSATEGSDRS